MTSPREESLREIFNLAQTTDTEIVKLFNREVGGRGLTGICGDGTIDEAINMLQSSINMLKRIKESKMTSPREVLIRFGMEVESRSGERKVILDQALSDLAEIVLAQKFNIPNEKRIMYDKAITDIAKLFTDKEQTKKGER